MRPWLGARKSQSVFCARVILQRVPQFVNHSKKQCYQHFATSGRPLPETASGPFSSSNAETARRAHRGETGRKQGRRQRNTSLHPEFANALPATCKQSFVDHAFGYYRPGGEVGMPLPLPVQVSTRNGYQVITSRLRKAYRYSRDSGLRVRPSLENVVLTPKELRGWR